MKNILYSFCLLMLLVLSGCNKALDINQNPNRPVEEYMEPSHFLPRVLDITGNRVSTTYTYAARWMGYWARSGNYGASVDEESYMIGSNFASGQAQWTGWYAILFDNHMMEKLGKEKNQPFYVAAAKLLKTVGFMYLVDQFNNVPYSQAFQLTSHILPAYDKGEAIYADLLKQLDTAVTLFKAYDVNANANVREADIMFGGDINMWRKLANTQRLKLLIRMSETGIDLNSEIQKLRDDDAGFLGSGETASINPGYTRDNSKQSPFWNAHVEGVDGNPIDNFNRANNFLLNLYRDHNDIRYRYVFAEAITPVGGERYVGYDFGDTSPGLPQAVNSSGVDGPSFRHAPTQDQWFFTSVESLFLQAEAIQRGWLAGDAEQAYRAAVRESFIWLLVGGDEQDAVQAADNYLASGQAIVDWSQAASAKEKIELIIMQKYLALVGLNNFESWADYRRVGVPVVPLSIYPGAAISLPIRLRYPQSEYSFNAPNVEKEGNIDHFTSGIFWDK
jgi:hypothetical protein